MRPQGLVKRQPSPAREPVAPRRPAEGRFRHPPVAAGWAGNKLSPQEKARRKTAFRCVFRLVFSCGKDATKRGLFLRKTPRHCMSCPCESPQEKTRRKDAAKDRVSLRKDATKDHVSLRRRRTARPSTERLCSAPNRARAGTTCSVVSRAQSGLAAAPWASFGLGRSNAFSMRAPGSASLPPSQSLRPSESGQTPAEAAHYPLAGTLINARRASGGKAAAAARRRSRRRAPYRLRAL